MQTKEDEKRLRDLRDMAKRMGYSIKSCQRAKFTYANHGEFMLVRDSDQQCIIGNRYNASIDDLAEKLVQIAQPIIAEIRAAREARRR